MRNYGNLRLEINKCIMFSVGYISRVLHPIKTQLYKLIFFMFSYQYYICIMRIDSVKL